MGNAPGNKNIVNRYKNEAVRGSGGHLAQISGRVQVLVVAFDYKNPACMSKAGCGELTSTEDGKRFAALCESCPRYGANYNTLKYFDTEGQYPKKGLIMNQMIQAAKCLGPEDLFIFFYAGHGTQVVDTNGDESDGMDEALCFVKEDGSPDWLVDDELAELLLQFHPKTRVLVITDCCHCGTVGDLDRPELRGRPICHMGAVTDKQCAIDLGSGGAFTSALLETVETINRQELRDVSAVEVFNAMYGRYESRVEGDDQTFTFAHPTGFDPDTFPWPLEPYDGWEVRTAFDNSTATILANNFASFIETATHKRDVSPAPTEILARPLGTQPTPAGSFVPLPKTGHSAAVAQLTGLAQPVAGLSQPILPSAVSQLPDFRDPLPTRNLPRPVTTGPISAYSPAPSPRVVFRDVSASTTVIRRDLSARRCPPLPPSQQPGSGITTYKTTATSAPLRTASPSARCRSGIATRVPASARSASPVTIGTALPVRRTVRSVSPSPMATSRSVTTKITTLPPDSPHVAVRPPVLPVQQPCVLPAALATRELLPVDKYHNQLLPVIAPRHVDDDSPMTVMIRHGDDDSPLTVMPTVMNGGQLPPWSDGPAFLDVGQEDSSQPLPIPDVLPPQRAPGSQNVLPVATPPLTPPAPAVVAAQQVSPAVVSRTVTTTWHPPVTIPTSSVSTCCNYGTLKPVLGGYHSHGNVSIQQIRSFPPTPLSSGLLRQFQHIGATYGIMHS